jgi:glucosamine--fructose-6-phosphate aminotransferase (isomerizing)
MCGIFGIIKVKKNISNTKNIYIHKLILSALNLLKNRGYDSCGIYLGYSGDKNNDNDNKYEFIEKFGVDGKAIAENKNLNIFDLMKEKINQISEHINFTKGIGHTRWATHGGKTDFNSHPHISNDGKIKLVHNGIISNYDELKKKYLKEYKFKSSTDSEVIANMIEYLKKNNPAKSMEEILNQLTELMEGTWACIISDTDNPSKLFFIKNESPLLIGLSDTTLESESVIMFTSEPSGFMNMVQKYLLLREKTYGYVSINGEIKINGDYKELELIKSTDNDINLNPVYSHWMIKEIYDQSKLNVLIDPITNQLRYSQDKIILPNINFISKCKYLYIIACGSSYYAGLLASNYFRFTKAFEFVNVFDGGEFTRAHLEAIEDPESNLLVILISQSGETRDLNIAATICREFSSNRKKKLKPNDLLNKNNSVDNFINIDQKNDFEKSDLNNEIKIIGIINVIGSLISRRTIENIYTNCGRENAVASTKSCTAQILSCLLLAIYKSELNSKLESRLKNKFLFDLNKLQTDITQTINLEEKIKSIGLDILGKKKSSIFILGKDELNGAALEGALKIKEIAYMHAEGYNISALKHGPYAMIEYDTPIILLYKNRDHFVKSIVEEIKTRGAYVIEISSDCDSSNPNSIQIPVNKTFTGLLCVIVLQLLSYHLSIAQGINPDMPRNLAKVVTVD